MIDGIGFDMIDVERVARSIDKESGFREMVFSAGEIAYCEPKANKAEHYAARFAAKEAFFKALGTGWANGTAFNEVEIVHGENSKPMIRLSGETAKTLAELNIKRILVSLSHLRDMAGAMVIIEK